jgi:hypothetical protein
MSSGIFAIVLLNVLRGADIFQESKEGEPWWHCEHSKNPGGQPFHDFIFLEAHVKRRPL